MEKQQLPGEGLGSGAHDSRAATQLDVSVPSALLTELLDSTTKRGFVAKPERVRQL